MYGGPRSRLDDFISIVNLNLCMQTKIPEIRMRSDFLLCLFVGQVELQRAARHAAIEK